METISIVVAAVQPINREGLTRLLQGQPGFEVLGTTDVGAATVALVRDRAPDVLLLHCTIPDASFEVLRRLQDSDAKARPVLLMDNVERQELVELLLLGARGLLFKNSDTVHLFECIRRVALGEWWFAHDGIPNLIEAFRELSSARAATPRESLTKREINVVAAVVEGATNRDISRQLGLSPQTVKNHLTHIYDKVGVSNRLELALFAIHHRLIDTRVSVPATSMDAAPSRRRIDRVS